MTAHATDYHAPSPSARRQAALRPAGHDGRARSAVVSPRGDSALLTFSHGTRWSRSGGTLCMSSEAKGITSAAHRRIQAGVYAPAPTAGAAHRAPTSNMQEAL